MNNQLEMAQRALNERSRVTLGRDIAPTLSAPATGTLTPEPLVSSARPLRSWLADPELLRTPAAVIPHLAVSGRVTLLSGREKIGKSTLVAGAVATASRGDDVLGVPLVRPVRTLWYALDEHVADCVRRFESLNADLDHIVINDVPRTDAELIGAIELDIAAFPGIGLVVVDTLSRVFAASGVDPNSSRDVEPVIARLVDLFHRQKVGSILLYHTGKAGREYRGSTAIGANVGDILTLRRRGQADEDDFEDEAADDGRRLLVQDGRNLRGRLQLTCAEGQYRLYDDAWPPRIRILEPLRDHGSVKSRTELVRLAGVQKKSGLRLVGEMVDEGTVVENSHRLTLGSIGHGELGSRTPAAPRAPAAPEPDVHPPEFPGFQRFSEGGTSAEPRREPMTGHPRAGGSRISYPHSPHPTETGTAFTVNAPVQLRTVI